MATSPEEDHFEAVEFTEPVILAVKTDNYGKLGACYYDPHSKSLQFLLEIIGGGDIVECLERYVQPQTIIIPVRASGPLAEWLNPQQNICSLPYTLEKRPSAEFDYQVGKKRLGELFNNGTRSLTQTGAPDVGGCDQEQIPTQAAVMHCNIDWNCRLSVGCASAVLTYLKRHDTLMSSVGQMQNASALNYLFTQMFILPDIMMLNKDAFTSLQLMKSSSKGSHALRANNRRRGRENEEMCLCDIFQGYAKTPLGKMLIWKSFLQPSLDTNKINERLDTIEVLVRPQNDEFSRLATRTIASTKDVKTILRRLKKGELGRQIEMRTSSSAWSSLRLFAYNAIRIRDLVCDQQELMQLQIGQEVAEKFEAPILAEIGRAISHTIDFPRSAEMNHTTINAGVDEELDKLKRSYDGMEDMLTLVSRDVSSSAEALGVNDLMVVFYPQIGFLISVPSTFHPDLSNNDANGEQWERIFSTAGRFYYKDFRMRQLDECWGDVYGLMCGREIEILHDLTSTILEHESLLLSTFEICGKLDFFLALAQAARFHQLTRPIICQENVLDVRNGRHPLLELQVPSFIPNDVYLASESQNEPVNHAKGSQEPTEDTRHEHPAHRQIAGVEAGPSTMILTGPNNAGKSVLMKSVAMIVYLAHIGCFVPAEKAIVGVTDKIISPSFTTETISTSQSTFMGDLQSANLAIAQATSRSLVLIDEFGKGTRSPTGAGLYCGLMKHFMRSVMTRPKVIASTHFHEIFETGYLMPQPCLSLMQMEVTFDERSMPSEDQIVYLYALRPGRSTISYGRLCAASNGINRAILDRAKDLVHVISKGSGWAAACAKSVDDEFEELQSAERNVKEFLSTDWHVL